MLTTVLMMYITLAPAILSGILNMIWCKTGLLKSLKKPMDMGRNFTDGRRIFGDNKTWKGFLGYLVFNTIFSVIWGLLCSTAGIDHLNFFYVDHDNTLLFNSYFYRFA